MVETTGTSGAKPAAGGFERSWKLAAGVNGWLSKGQAEALADAAAAVPEGAAIVEIGSHHGRSTLVLARHKRPGVRLLAVDPFDDPRWGGGEGAYDTFLANLDRAGVAADVEAFRGTSEQAAAAWDGGEIGFLYIDGAHDRRSVLIDIDRWKPFLADGARVYLHDAYSSPGVTFALLQRHLLSRSARYTGSVRSLAMFERGRLSGASAASSAARMLARLGWFARNIAIKVAIRRGWERPQRLLGHREPGYPY